MNSTQVKTYTFQINQSRLVVVLADFMGDAINPQTSKIIKEVFTVFAPHLKDELQVLIVRDNKYETIGRNIIGANCYNRHELLVAVPGWPIDEGEFKSTLCHEMHHLARHQNNGYGTTLGAAILSEGLATYYEKIIGWQPPWAEITYTTKDLEDALSHWNDEDFDHPEWFFQSKRGRWVGYSIGYQIAQSMYKDNFDLGESIMVEPGEPVANIIKELILAGAR
jgi:hypothetical protein